MLFVLLPALVLPLLVTANSSQEPTASELVWCPSVVYSENYLKQLPGTLSQYGVSAESCAKTFRNEPGLMSLHWVLNGHVEQKSKTIFHWPPWESNTETVYSNYCGAVKALIPDSVSRDHRVADRKQAWTAFTVWPNSGFGSDCRMINRTQLDQYTNADPINAVNLKTPIPFKG